MFPVHTFETIGLLIADIDICTDVSFNEPDIKLLLADIDECRTDPTVCKNGRCENTEGGYKCTCFSGFQVSRDGKYCHGTVHINITNTAIVQGTLTSQILP